MELGSHMGGRDRFGQLCAPCHVYGPEQAGVAGSQECSPTSSLLRARTSVAYRRSHPSNYICSLMGEAPKPSSSREGRSATQEQTPLPPLAGDTVLCAEPKNTIEGLLCQQPLSRGARRTEEPKPSGRWVALGHTLLRLPAEPGRPQGSLRNPSCTKPIAGLAGAQAPPVAGRKEQPAAANSCASWK